MVGVRRVRGVIVLTRVCEGVGGSSRAVFALVNVKAVEGVRRQVIDFGHDEGAGASRIEVNSAVEGFVRGVAVDAGGGVGCTEEQLWEAAQVLCSHERCSEVVNSLVYVRRRWFVNFLGEFIHAGS